MSCNVCPKTGYWGYGFEIAKHRTKEECEKYHILRSLNQLNDRIRVSREFSNHK